MDGQPGSEMADRAPAGPGAGPAPSEARSTPEPGLAPVDRRIFVVAAALFALLMAFSARYGFYRDELYFLDGGRHLSLSYVDQPIFTPLVARLSLDLFGVSLTGLRLWPALAAFATVVTGGLLARELGGGRMAQLVGALGVATSPVLLAADHTLGTTSFDLLAWSALALTVLRIGRTGDMRLWMPAGVILGLGLTNKHSIGFFALALVIGILLSGGRSLLASRYFAVGALIAVAFTIPDLWWQSQHGWATIAMTHVLAQENGGLPNAITFIVSQLFMAAPFLIGVWIIGLRFLWRSGRPVWRALAWSYGLLVVFFAVTSGAKPYYVAATYFFLLAAGAVAIEQRRASRTRVHGRVRTLLSWLGAAACAGVCVLVTLALALPVLPASRSGWTSAINPVQIETIGWPEFVGTVDHVWYQLPPAQRAGAVIFTGNYGEDGAINELGRADHLPEAVGGQNTDWWWGPGNPRATTVVAVVQSGYGQLVTMLHRDFAHVRIVATIGNPEHVANQEQGGHIYLCRDPIRPWGQLWPSFRHYN
jgi:4-amino-4-deoxy-L-arabinose transferase-like glycosyltransferase